VFVRILSVILAFVVLATTVASADPPASSADPIELVDLDVIAPHAITVTVIDPVRQLIVATLPPLVTLSPRLHIPSLFRPPRA